MAENLNQDNARYFLLTGAAGGLLGMIHSIASLYFQVMDDSITIAPNVIILIAVFWVLFTSIGFLGINRTLQSPSAYRTFHSGVFTCILLLVYLSALALNQDIASTWPASLSGGFDFSVSIFDLMLFGSMFVFFVLSGMTFVRFGFDYSFGPLFIWTGFSYLFAAFAQFTFVVHISTLIPAFLSVYLFYSLAEWMD